MHRARLTAMRGRSRRRRGSLFRGLPINCRQMGQRNQCRRLWLQACTETDCFALKFDWFYRVMCSIWSHHAQQSLHIWLSRV